MVREAEAAKARMIGTPGRYHSNIEEEHYLQEQESGSRSVYSPQKALQHKAAVVDEEYLVIGGHIDTGLREKIEQFDYIDFACLLPKDRVTCTDDHRMELIIKNGSTFFASVADRESTSINSFNKWEQAFRIYSNIITKAHPNKSGELIQYNRVIFTASLSYQWDNVYFYEKEFRTHISKFPKPELGYHTTAGLVYVPQGLY